MKKPFLLVAILGFALSTAHAQQTTKTDTILVITKDSVISKENKSGKKTRTANIKVTIGNRDKVGVSTGKNKSSVSIGFDFDRFDFGFSRYLDQGSFTLSPANSFLEFEPAKTSNFGFDFFQFKYKATPNFRFFIAAGLDWNHIRLKKNITMQKNQPVLSWEQDNINFTKNRFSSQYLRIPIGFDFSKTYKNGEKFHVELGPELGFLLNGKVKQVSKERGKEKFKDDYNFNPFRYGAFARVGYKNMGIYTRYFFNDVFAENQGPKDFKNMSFGLSVGF